MIQRFRQMAAPGQVLLAACAAYGLAFLVATNVSPGSGSTAAALAAVAATVGIMLWQRNQPDQQEVSFPMTADTTIRSAEERKAVLAQHVAQAVARGARVESQSDYQAVVIYGKRVNHVLHAILSVLMVGLWLIVWVLLVLTGGEKRQLIQVDDYGNVRVQKV